MDGETFTERYQGNCVLLQLQSHYPFVSGQCDAVVDSLSSVARLLGFELAS